MKWSTFRADLNHHHYDTFAASGGKGVNVFNENPLDGELVTFRLDEAGSVGTLEWYGRTFKRAGKGP